MTAPLTNGIAGARSRARCEAVSPRAVRGGSSRTRVGAVLGRSQAILEGGVASLADKGQKRRKRLKGLPLGVASVFLE